MCQKELYCESLLKPSLGIGALVSSLNPCLKKIYNFLKTKTYYL